MSKAVNFFRSLGACSEGISSFLKLVVSGSVVLGSYYLGCYIVLNDVALPINLAATVTLLIALGLTAAMILALVIFYVLMGSVITLKIFGEPFAYLLSTSDHGIIAPSLGRQVQQLLIVFVLPQLVAYALLQQSSFTTKEWAYVFVTFFAMPLAYGYNKARIQLNSTKQSYTHSPLAILKRALEIAASIFMMHVLAGSSAVFFFFILDLRGMLNAPGSICAAEIFFLFINTTCLVSRISPDFLETPARKSAVNRLTVPDAAYRSYAKFAGAFLVLVSLAPNIGSQVGQVTLTVLGIGGGVKRVVYAPEDGKGALPPQLVSKCDKEAKICNSKVVELLLDAGDSATVRLISDRQTEIFRLHTEESTLAWVTKRSGPIPTTTRGRESEDLHK